MIFKRLISAGMNRILIILHLFGVQFGAADEIRWERPVIIGASLSDGFYLPEMGLPFVSPKSKSLGLHHHLEAALKVKHGPVLNVGSNWFFLAAEPKGIFQTNRAHQAQPTVVFAIDFLFWYLSTKPEGRGRGFRDLSRLDFFEKGLAHLATFDCPVVVGNIPDAGKSVGRVLTPSQYPGQELVNKANARLEEWLKDHPNVVLMDLHQFHGKASRNQEMKVAGREIPAEQSRDLFLQWDLIHPTGTGAKAVMAMALKALGVTEEEARLGL